MMLKRAITTYLVFCSVVSASSAFSQSLQRYDWRFYAAEQDWNGKKGQVDLLYLSNQIQPVGPDDFRVCSETLSDTAVENLKATKERLALLASEMRAYDPPYARIAKLTPTVKVRVLESEYVADQAAVPAVTKTLFEIDCRGQRFKLLDEIDLKNGNEQAIGGSPNWHFVPPGSLISNLAALVCPAPAAK